MRRRSSLLIDEATRRVDDALIDIAAARTELDVAVAELTHVLDSQERHHDR